MSAEYTSIIVAGAAVATLLVVLIVNRKSISEFFAEKEALPRTRGDRWNGRYLSVLCGVIIGVVLCERGCISLNGLHDKPESDSQGIIEPPKPE